MATAETNFEAIPGPTHNYGGLAAGNLASMAHGQQVSNPRLAALEGLEKMKFLCDLGVSQAVLPPHDRPDVGTLRRLGFGGSDGEVLEGAAKFPAILAACGSASAMWAANAATVSPSADTADGRLHFTPANLISQFHRSLEAGTTAAILKAIFADETVFAHHARLPASGQFADEGAANHMRIAGQHDERGVEIFVYGRRAMESDARLPSRFAARQTLEASAAVARLHQLDPKRTMFLQQNPEAIDAGAFHNDVVAVGNANVLMYHESAFVESDEAALRERLEKEGCHLFKGEMPLGDAVSSYLFNSQLVSLAEGSMVVIAPMESRENPRAREFLEGLVGRGMPIGAVHFVDVRQSMNNGGGPACLRLRVVMTNIERSLANSYVFLNDDLYWKLRNWIQRHYRDRLAPGDLADPKLLEESRSALSELTGILHLGSIYSFQK